MGGLVNYNIDHPKGDTVIHNVTLHLRTPLNNFPRLDVGGTLATDKDIKSVTFTATTVNTDISVDANSKVSDNEMLQIPHTRLFRESIIVLVVPKIPKSYLFSPLF